MSTFMKRAAPAALAMAIGSSWGPAAAEPLIWGIQAEQLERRFGEDDLLAWDLDAVIGDDELKLRAISEGEYLFGDDVLEDFENQLTLETPISAFFDAKAGVRYDAPVGENRAYAVVGLHGLAQQWIEVDLDLFLSEKGELSSTLDAEYEALITQRIILVTSLDVDLPFSEDRAIGAGAWGPTVELGARLSYDLVGRMVSPYVGVHYERAFGDTASFRRAEGEDDDAVYFVVGARLMF